MAKFIVTYLTVIYVKYNFKKQTKKKRKPHCIWGLLILTWHGEYLAVTALEQYCCWQKYWNHFPCKLSHHGPLQWGGKVSHAHLSLVGENKMGLSSLQKRVNLLEQIIRVKYVYFFSHLLLCSMESLLL